MSLHARQKRRAILIRRRSRRTGAAARRRHNSISTTGTGWDCHCGATTRSWCINTGAGRAIFERRCRHRRGGADWI